jgi:DNA polymerase-3 subunit delta
MVYLFLDCDEYLTAHRVQALKADLGDPELAGLNITELEGNGTSAADLLGQAAMMPFLAPRRLIVVRGYLAQLEKRMAQSKSSDSAAYLEAAQFLTGLADLRGGGSDSADLLLIESALDKRRGIWKGFTVTQTDIQKEGTQKESPQAKGERAVPGLQALIADGSVVQETLTTPDSRNLAGWIADRARTRKIALDGRAIQQLAAYVGPNLRQLDNELEKLSLYAGQRTISAQDVGLLVSDGSEALIWSLTDALSQRNGRAAMTALMTLRRGDNHPIYLLTMIARQYRLILKVKDAMVGQGRADEHAIAKLVGERSAFPVKKAMQQTGAYSFDDLVEILDRIMIADNAMKTGAEPDTEIDLLIAELTQKPVRRPDRRTALHAGPA